MENQKPTEEIEPILKNLSIEQLKEISAIASRLIRANLKGVVLSLVELVAQTFNNEVFVSETTDGSLVLTIYEVYKVENRNALLKKLEAVIPQVMDRLDKENIPHHLMVIYNNMEQKALKVELTFDPSDHFWKQCSNDLRQDLRDGAVDVTRFYEEVSSYAG